MLKLGQKVVNTLIDTDKPSDPMVDKMAYLFSDIYVGQDEQKRNILRNNAAIGAVNVFMKDHISTPSQIVVRQALPSDLDKGNWRHEQFNPGCEITWLGCMHSMRVLSLYALGVDISGENQLMGAVLEVGGSIRARLDFSQLYIPVAMHVAEDGSYEFDYIPFAYLYLPIIIRANVTFRFRFTCLNSEPITIIPFAYVAEGKGAAICD